ncbi:helix-turn-helix domain-containing protein [Kitasatospora sp. NPDC051984]|uniref:helix-turn-helix domain-containing protein n=1 Tax=Kitasatospora sp. NPDC051984 TaxID=3364059 RepID=UPI0037CC7886
MPQPLPDAHQPRERREVAERIRHFRHQRGLSQERLAEVIGRDRQTVGLWERAVTPPTVDDLSALARALQIQTWRLFYG